MADPQTLVFFVPGEPKGRAHTKSFAVRRKQAGNWHYTGRTISAPQESREQANWYAAIRGVAVQTVQERGWQKPERGALKLTFEIIMPRPQRFNWRTPHAEPYCWRGTDLDNILKALKDSLRGVLWRDDSQIAFYGESGKRYARLGEQCGALITVVELGEWQEVLADEMASPRTEAQATLL